jgi:hypothetical protein
MVYKPAWFRDDQVFVSYATTVGINKDGNELFIVDPVSGMRTPVIDDVLAHDVDRLIDQDGTGETSRWIPATALTERLMAVPVYFDERSRYEFDSLMRQPEMAGFTSKTLGELITSGSVLAMHGHGTPSADLRTADGPVPYIKVSDIRAGQVNINPTNRVPDVVARRFWKGSASGLRAYDLITPIRTSKNIGEFAVLMPGQERVVLTKEVLILRAAEESVVDNFYLLWAMTLNVVRRQWARVVFMQTNREDVGSRYREIQIPFPADRETADAVSRPFRDYYLGTQRLRDEFLQYLSADSKHHIFMSAAAALDSDE